MNIITANGSSITITGSGIELDVQNVAQPSTSRETVAGTNNAPPVRRRPSQTRLRQRNSDDQDKDDDQRTTVDWIGSDSLARQIDADRVRLSDCGHPTLSDWPFCCAAEIHDTLFLKL